jgi:hypothetical protein
MGSCTLFTLFEMVVFASAFPLIIHREKKEKRSGEIDTGEWKKNFSYSILGAMAVDVISVLRGTTAPSVQITISAKNVFINTVTSASEATSCPRKLGARRPTMLNFDKCKEGLG